MKIDACHYRRHFQLILATRQMMTSTGTVDHCDDVTTHHDDVTMTSVLPRDVSVLPRVLTMTLVSFRVEWRVTMCDDDVCDDCDVIVGVDNFVVVVVVVVVAGVDKLTTFDPNRSVMPTVMTVDSVDNCRVDLGN